MTVAKTDAVPICPTCGRLESLVTIGKSTLVLCSTCCITLADPCPHPWRPFPILNVDLRNKEWNGRWPTYFPWGLLWPHQAQAEDNHGQSLERLAERGGLSVVEMLFIIQGKTWRNAPRVTMTEAMRQLRIYRLHWMRRNH